MKQFLLAAVFAVTLLMIGQRPALAQEESVNIEAGEMEIIDADKQAIFRGDVVAKRSTETIRANQMVVTYVDVKQADGSTKTEVDTMVCTGGVTITTPTQTITGGKATFRVRKDELVVTGDVKVVQGKTVLRGPELVASLKTKKTIMRGGRIKGTFAPP